MTEETLGEEGFSYDESQAPIAFEQLIAAFPQHEETIGSCMWMGSERMMDESIRHHFKHRDTRNKFTFRPQADGSLGGTVIGRIETGEDSADGNAVLSALTEI